MPRRSTLLALCACLIFSAPARAATTLGQLDPAAAPGGSCVGDSPFVQGAETGAGSYTVPAGGGVITSWSHKANATAGRQLALRVWRPTATAGTYILVGAGGFETLNPSTVNTFAVRLPVLAGDRIGLRVGNPGSPFPFGGGASCMFSSAVGNTVGADFLSPDPSNGGTATLVGVYASNRLNATARVEADADNDGFGDETQDTCPGSAGTVNGCIASGLPGTSPPGTSPAKDTVAPGAKLRARRQAVKRGRVRLTVTPTEDATVSVTGRLPIARAAKVHRLRKVTRAAKANKPLVVRLRLPKPVQRAVKRALRKRKRVRVKLTVKLTDTAGNTGTVRGSLRLKR